MSCLKKESKPIVPLKTLDIIFRRRYVKNTQFYFTNRKLCSNSPTENLNGKTLLPYRAPKSDKLLSYIRYSDRDKRFRAQQELSQPLHLKSNKNVPEISISRRLFVEELPDDVKAVVAIHPEFYTSIEGRPLRMFDDIKVYINNIRNYAMSRQQLGYRRDLIMKIEKNISEESEEYNKISENLKNYGHHFQEFLIEDYKEACAVESKAERIYAELLAKQTELLTFSSNLINLNNEIYKLDSTANILRSYRKFLMLIAPLTWRQKHDRSLQNGPEYVLFTENNSNAEARDIDRIVKEVKKELQNSYPIQMYFTYPEELMDLFKTMQIQSRDYLIQRSKSRGTYYHLLRRINQLKTMATDNVEYFNYYIEHFQKELDREEYNQKNIREKFYRILNNNFYEDIASVSSLKLLICVEYVYEQVIGKYEEGQQNVIDIMTVLENMYQDYNLGLDTLDFNTVNQARNDIFAQDLKTMKNAYNAERELKTFQEMTKALNQAFAPPKEFTKPVMTVRLKKNKNLNKKHGTDSEDKRILTRYNIGSKERNFLLYFTEWCDDTDPLPFLKQFH